MTAFEPVSWPVKVREIHNHHMNSTTWNDFPFRDDDIVIATYAKSGTTWLQQIISQLLFNGAEDAPAANGSPWVDLRIMPADLVTHLEAIPHRRVLKTHLPVDALVYSPRAKYLYLGRDGRDTVWSLFNHYLNTTEEMRSYLNDAPGRVGPPLPRCPEDPRQFYLTWFEKNGAPYWPFWENVRSWWAIRDLPNLKLVHFNNLKADLPGSIREIARFLDIDIDEARLPTIVDHCTFDYMKAHAEQMAPGGGGSWVGGATTFINRGTNGRWRDVLTPGEVAQFDAEAVRQLGADCAQWLASGTIGNRG